MALGGATELPRKLDDLCKLTAPATFHQRHRMDGDDTEVFTIELSQKDLEDDERIVAATFRVTDAQTKEWCEVQFWERLKGGWNAYVDGHKHRAIVESIPDFIDRDMEMPGRDTRAELRSRATTGVISTRETDLRSDLGASAQASSFHM
jgi:hypothetical protein